MTDPKVSIVIPAFNAESTLAATLSSLSRQSLGDWEAIIVDDGSADRTPELIRDHARADARFRALFPGHGGASAARNAGIAAARGEWLIFLDSDDELPADHLAVMMDAAGRHQQAGLIYCGWRRYAPEGTLLGEYPAEDMESPFARSARTCPFAIHAAMVRRDAVTAAGGFDRSVSICQDWDLWQRLARSGLSFSAVGGHMVDVRMRPGSLSSDSLNLCREGLVMIERGFGPDPRVTNAHPGHINGESVSGLTAARAYYLLWSLGNAIGRGENIEPLLRLAETCFEPTPDMHGATATFVDGLLIGAGKRLDGWNDLWPGVAPAFDRLIEWLNGRSGATSYGGRFKWHVERHVSGLLPGRELLVGGLQVVRIDPTGTIHDLHPPARVDRVRCHITAADSQLGWFETLSFGSVPAAELAESILESVTPDELAAIMPPSKGVWRSHVGKALSFLTGRAVSDDTRFAPLRVAHSNIRTNRIKALADEENARWRAADPTGSGDGALYVPPDYSSQDYWESVFETRDPWDYESSYETVKYQQTLDTIPDGPVRRALEIACAEGHFTRRLADRVDDLLATDISTRALARAQERCGDVETVRFAQLDLARDEIPGRFDLIVCSEVLYYQADAAALNAFAEKMAAALEEGGTLILAHGNLLVDEPDKTGFPWPHPFGAKGIGDQLNHHPALHLEREFWTPLYRIHRYRRTAAPALPATGEVGHAASRLPPRLSTQIRWRGGHEAPVAGQWHDFPILGYHRVADHGPDSLAAYRVRPDMFERQLALLRQNGWQGISHDRLVAALYEGQPIGPRSVMLTFDDAYVDFLESALPLLHRYGFPATVFLPTGKAGGRADWDIQFGEPAPLLGWEDVALLRHADVSIGSHGHSHTSLPALAPEMQVRDLAGSRAELSHRLGQQVTGIAYPFGEHHPALHRAARQCGYKIGVTCDPGWVSQNADPLALPRIEIFGDLPLEGFASLLGVEN